MSQPITNHTSALPSKNGKNTAATPTLRQKLLLTFASLALSACQITGPPGSNVQQPRQSLASALTQLTQAQTDSSAERPKQLLDSAQALIAVQAYDKAHQAISLLPGHLSDSQTAQYKLIKAQLNLINHRRLQAKQLLTSLGQNQLNQSQKAIWLMLKADLARQQQHPQLALQLESQLTPLLDESDRRQQTKRIWKHLASLPSHPSHIPSNIEKAWYQLASIIGPYKPLTSQSQEALAAWLKQHPNHPAHTLFEDARSIIVPENNQRICFAAPVKSPEGKAMQLGLITHFYEIPKHLRPSVLMIDTEQFHQHEDPNLCDTIIGHIPHRLLMSWRQQMPSHPIINLDIRRLLWQTKANIAEELTLQASRLGAHRAIIIAPEQGLGASVGNKISKSWRHQGKLVLSKLTYKPETEHSKGIAELLEIDQSQTRKRQLEQILWRSVDMAPRRRQDIDAFFLIANNREAKSFVPLLQYYYAQDIPVILVLLDDPEPQTLAKDLKSAWIYGSPWIATSAKTWQQAAEKLLARQPSPLLLSHFALGYDALHLALAWDKLKRFPHLAISAATGTLSANDHAQLNLQGAWTKVGKHGPELLEPLI